MGSMEDDFFCDQIAHVTVFADLAPVAVGIDHSASGFHNDQRKVRQIVEADAVGNGVIRDVRFRNLVFTRAGRGISVQCNYGSGKGGVDISRVSFENVRIADASVGICVTGGAGTPTAKLEDVVFRNVAIEAVMQPIRVVGRSRTRPRNIAFEDVVIRGVAKCAPDDGEAGGEDGIPGTNEPIRVLAADNVTFRDVTVLENGVRRPASVASRDVGL